MIDDARSAPAFDAYVRARDAVVRIKQQAERSGSLPPGADPSSYWAEELDNIDYMIDASPLIVRKLRQHAFHITGIRSYDYRNAEDSRRSYFEARLQQLRALGGDRLLVPESPALGGFGYTIDGQLYNVDTLKFYEVLIGMERAEVLAQIRGIDRPLVCEIGAGWGGFAYQFKTLFPAATYVIIDFPELFLFSATYLATLFPDARLHFCGTGDEERTDTWADADFVFVPNGLSSLVASVPVDLTVNMVSFQEMTDAQVRGYAAMAAAAGCPLLYSLNRERSPYNRELVSVTQALAESYRVADVPVLDTDYVTAMKKPPQGARRITPGQLSYRHVVGRLEHATRRQPRESAPGPRVVLGMTLYNNAQHLPEAIDSLLAQTRSDFVLVLLDDASSDATETIARRYAAQDPRVRYFRHDTRRAMIATWHEVAEIAARECPSASYFAWVSDHDRWHPRWLECLLTELDRDAGAVLAYPITRRMLLDGQEVEKGPRLFNTMSLTDRSERWEYFCRHGVGAGDMVYGLIRMDALRTAGIFRRVLRPDRLLMAELTLQGRICQYPEVLWFRRQSTGTSVERQRHTLVLPGEEPKWFSTPPWLQHTLVLWEEYVKAPNPPIRIAREEWIRMLLSYQLRYGWRHFRKTDTSHAVGRTIHTAVWTKKLTKHYVRHAVYNTLVAGHACWGRLQRARRRVVYEALMLTHRLGLRGRGQA